MRRLPVFKGYTVDERLRQFRKVSRRPAGPSIAFIDFDSLQGQRLLRQMQRSSVRRDEQRRDDTERLERR